MKAPSMGRRTELKMHESKSIKEGKMGKKLLSILCVSLLLLAGFTLTVSAQQPKVIKIGAVYPLTGNIASTGLDCRRGAELAVEIINGKYDLNLPLAKTAGLPNLGGAKIELVFADTKGEPKNGMSEAERLISQEKVVAMIGAYQSSVTKTASQATERLKVPYVCSDSSSPTLTERNYKYFFRVSPHDSGFARDQFQFLKDLEKKTGQKVTPSPFFMKIRNSAPMWAKPRPSMQKNSATKWWQMSPTQPMQRT